MSWLKLCSTGESHHAAWPGEDLAKAAVGGPAKCPHKIV
jgi:hypothetical protein